VTAISLLYVMSTSVFFPEYWSKFNPLAPIFSFPLFFFDLAACGGKYDFDRSSCI